ncbi:MAG TPA: tetratricopeptide repeat protein [Polyangiaceae bacterium]|jgi:tetratricopeptide (TPR) repeat protein|nr:tetratricopeptide repeat protein [Polyangiaceae bacterium]
MKDSRTRRGLGPREAALLVSAALAFVGCDSPSPPPQPAAASAAPAPSDAAPSAEAPEAKPASPEHRLALQKTVGGGGADRAIDAAQARAQKTPDNNDAWIVLGRAWVRKARESADPGFYLNARACAQIVKKTDPDSRLAKDLEGLVLLNNHEFEAARQLAESVVRKSPDDPMAFGNLADAELELGLYDDCLRHTQAMMALKPNLASYARASYLSWLRGDAKGAKEAIRAAIDAGRDRHDPEPRAWVLTQAATIFFHEGDLDGADAGVDMTLEWLRDYPPALALRGRIALVRNQGKRAVDALGKAHEQSPLVETTWLLADAKALAGDDAGAAESYARLEREGPKVDPRTYSLFLSSRGEKPERALALVEEEYTRRKDVLTEDARAFALLRAGKVKEAKASITKARRLGTPEPRMVFHEGAIRLAAGEKKAAEALLRAALANASLDRASRAEAERLLAAKKP